MSTNYQKGHDAEEIVRRYLTEKKYKIVDTNWKTKTCEIDIIAQKDECVFFVEVKSRTTDLQGDGFEYINEQKLNQMGYAARLWMEINKYTGECTLAAASVSSDNTVMFIEQL